MQPTNSIQHKMPPHNLRIEGLIIVMMILTPEVIDRAPLRLDHFYDTNYRLAYQTLLGMVKSREAINLPSFHHRYTSDGGNYSALSAFYENPEFCGPAFCDTYVKILAEQCASRKILERYQTLEDAPLEFIAEMKRIEYEFITRRPESVADLLAEYQEDYSRKIKLRESGKSTGLMTGFDWIDTNASLFPGNLAILAAKTSVGKTALALNIAYNAAMYGQKVLFFTVEMSKGELMDRIMAIASGVSTTKFKYANAGQSLHLAIQEVQPLIKNLEIVEASGMSSFEIGALCRQAHHRSPVGLVVVDYIQILGDPMAKGGTNNDRIGGITRNLKSLAMDIKAPVLALSQVNRTASGVPELHHLRDSGNIEQDSEIVMILHREEKSDTTASLAIAKNRNGQAGISTKLGYAPELTKFYEFSTNSSIHA